MDRLVEDGADPDTPVAVVYHASWPDEDVIEGTVDTIGDRLDDAGYRASAMVVIGPAARKAGYERSYLYGDWANGSGYGQRERGRRLSTHEHGRRHHDGRIERFDQFERRLGGHCSTRTPTARSPRRSR